MISLSVVMLAPWCRAALIPAVSPLRLCTGISISVRTASKSTQQNPGSTKEPLKKPKTPQGRFDETQQSNVEKDPLERFPDDINPITREKGGPRGPEPTRYGDWERKGRCIDF
ncbi:succinate dehydrogenase assembly factor 4, mitochondrial [Discoglossus pictus]